MRRDCLRFFILSVLVTGSAAAEDPRLDLRGYQPPLDPQSSLVLEPVTTPRSGDFSASWLTSYAYRLVRVLDENGTQLSVPVRHQFSYDALFNIGLGKRLVVGFAAPGVIYQTGDRVATDPFRPPPTALGDPSLEAKFVIVPKGELGGYGIASLTRMTLPLASPESGVGDGAITAQQRFLGELDLILLSIRASAGVTLRSQERVFWGDQFGHSAPWAAGVALRPQAFGWDKQGKWQWFVDAHGTVALTPQLATRHSSPVAIAASTRYALGSDVSALLGVEVPLNGAIGAPSLRAVLGLTWAPRFIDSDGDRIADDNDDCPEEMPEDRDGFEDDDGCPDDDNDNDGIADATDRCPNQAEDLDGFADEDGCPDPDNDKDDILDANDACPDAAGPPSKAKKYNGCPSKDSDGDGLLDDVDRCPDQPEDRDGHFDDDGCPDPDDDADGVLDGEDDCPTQRGPRREIKGLNGCPDPDQDGDTYFGNYGDIHAALDQLGAHSGTIGTPRDRCPDEAEDFDGYQDDDGCPDPEDPKHKTTPLVGLELSGPEGFVRFSRPLKWSSASSADVLASDLTLLRAIAKELRLHREWFARVGVRPLSASAEDIALADKRATTIVQLLQRLTLRTPSAQRTTFAEVQLAPDAKQSGIGIALASIPKRTADGTATPPGYAAPQPEAPPALAQPSPAASTGRDAGN